MHKGRFQIKTSQKLADFKEITIHSMTRATQMPVHSREKKKKTGKKNENNALTIYCSNYSTERQVK